MATSAVERSCRGVAILWFFCACTAQDPASPDPDPCDDVCWADPISHWVCTDSCRSDADCPAGLICAEQDEESDLGKCGPPIGVHTPSAVLIDGFEVEEMKSTLELVDGQVDGEDAVLGAELSWEAPGNATVVHCALFVCAPVIEDRRISNYEQCVIAAETSAKGRADGFEGAFSLFDEERQRSTRAEAGLCGETSVPEITSSRYAVTELLAACWAYDDRDLVAATSLARPKLEQVFNYYGDTFVDHGCTVDDDLGRSCSREDGTFGVCIENLGSFVCTRRCLKHEHCEGAEPESSGLTQTPDGTGDADDADDEWYCGESESSPLGACRAPTPPESMDEDPSRGGM